MFKKSTFCKGVSPWFFLKNGRFPNLFLWAEKARKKHFFIFWIVKNAFETGKVKFSQSRKKTTFCKGVSPLFLSKNRTFSRMFFFFEPNKAEKKHFLIFWIEKNGFLTTKDNFKKTLKNRHFAKKVSPGFLSKNRFLLFFFFLAKKARKKHFLIFWIENKVFWTSKVNFLQSRKIWTFCKGVSPWFFSKNRLFFKLFLSQKGQKERFFDILDRKECFLDLKSEVPKKSKKSTFCKGVMHLSM